ncbi:MAG: hypothetical protein JOY59_14005 [Candidatus Eremiobacteraeota bacterium]|nr:hypothetical protein [Candidatus Eremiobacteraeota bacterium]
MTAAQTQDEDVIVTIDATITPVDFVRHLVAVERQRYRAPLAASLPALPVDDRELARIVAEAIGDPELDERRILEYHVPELD